MKKLIAMGIAVGLIAGCTNNVEYTFGDSLRVRVRHAASADGSDSRGLIEIRARMRERCKSREGKVAMSFHGLVPLGLIMKGSTPTLSCAA